VFYTEPDKYTFFDLHLGALISGAASLAPNVVLVVARSQASLRTFPPHQRQTEDEINRLCGETLGCRGDLSYGPFMMPAVVARYLERVPEHAGWGWRHYIFAIARRLGYELVLHEGDYECPPDQRQEDAAEREHRDRQLRQNREGLSLGCREEIA
jgi:hypothetical protein